MLHSAALCYFSYLDFTAAGYFKLFLPNLWACDGALKTTWGSLPLLGNSAVLLQLQLQGHSFVHVLGGRLTRWSSIMLVSLWRITANQFVLYQSVALIRWRFYCGARRSQMTRLSACLITCCNSRNNVCATQITEPSEPDTTTAPSAVAVWAV